MAQYKVETGALDPKISSHYEVMYLANGAIGEIVSTKNRLPVDAAFSGTTGDAFGRLRVAEPFTLGDYKHLYSIDPNFIDFTANGGSVVFTGNTASATLSTNNTDRYTADFDLGNLYTMYENEIGKCVSGGRYTWQTPVSRPQTTTSRSKRI